MPIIGTPIPEWDELIRLVLQAAPVFAGIRTQSWDIALTHRGPVFLEMNFGGDLNATEADANPYLTITVAGGNGIGSRNGDG